MKPARWHEIEHLYNQALEMEESRRTSFLREACAGDDDLRRELEGLLAEERPAASFLEKPALREIAHEFAAAAGSTAGSSWVGRQIGNYEFVSLAGTGGMGEVYRARDTKLKREVAIKILPGEFSRDADRVSRFQREAQLLASLNHPNIAAIYNIEEENGFRFLILELVEGETLAERLRRGPIPLDDALQIAIQICEGLAAAHERGIIHRDLKPANIKMTPEGKVKVLDFGLAKAFAGAAANMNQSNSPTLVSGTRAGIVLGTAAYMSPEQAKGREVDGRTDIFAFGCVLYEMLTGWPAFEGENAPDILSAVLKTDPDWTRLPSDVPTRIRDLLRVCLQKDAKKRRQTATDVRIDIEHAQSAASDGRSPVVPIGSRRRERVALVSALALVTLIAAVLGARALRPAPAGPEARLEINTPPTRNSSLAISPDGLRIIFAAGSASQSQLWLRSLDSLLARPLTGTEGASSPFWSPDSRSIGFFADNKLKLMDIDGRSVKTLVSFAPAPFGGAWNSDGTIIFSMNPGRPIFRVSAEGGDPSAATRFESPQQTGHSSPQFLPDGRHFLFFVRGSPEARGVYIGQLDGLETKRLFDADAPAVYAATGHLLFIREGNLLAQDFELNRLEPTGVPFPVAEHVTGGTTLSASAAGPIAYRTPSADSGQRQLVWVDRLSREIEKVVYRDPSSQGPSLSRDGRRVAVFARFADGNMDIWSYDTGRRTWNRLTFDSGDDIFPLWSPDGSRIVFGSRRGEMNLYRKLLSAPPGSEELLLSTLQPKFPMDWSADGRFLLYDSIDPKRGWDIWALPLDGDRTPFAVVQTDFNERLGQFSPDGTWIAYQSNKTGRSEIYVQPLRGPGGDSPVSIDGGAQVRWNPNGKELFYIAPDDRLMAVPIRFASSGKAVEPGTPLGLFTTNVGSTAINTNRQQYAVSPDGQSFVMNSVLGGGSTSPITVILNWKPKP